MIFPCKCGSHNVAVGMDDYSHDPYVFCSDCGRRGQRIRFKFDVEIETEEAIASWNKDMAPI